MKFKDKMEALNERIDNHIETMFFAYDEQNYGFLVGLITAHNIMCKKGQEIKQMPDRPQVWFKHLNDAVQKEAEESKPKLWTPDNKIIT